MQLALSIDDNARMVMLVFGPMQNGRPYWCYVSVKPSRYEEFQKLMAQKNYNIQHFADDGYGEVIVSGEGVTPPPDVTKKVADMFNVPIRELFADIDAQSAIANKIQQINDSAGEA